MKLLNYGNIMEIYENVQYLQIVSEINNYKELLDYLKTEKEQYTEYFVSCIIKNLFNTVADLHENQIIHRDIKPDNILIK